MYWDPIGSNNGFLRLSGVESFSGLMYAGLLFEDCYDLAIASIYNFEDFIFNVVFPMNYIKFFKKNCI